MTAPPLKPRQVCLRWRVRPTSITNLSFSSENVMKISLAALAILALPIGVLAVQQPPAAPAAPPTDPITAAFRGRTMALQRNLAQAFDSIPASRFSYRPTPAQLTIGFIAQHLAND